MVIDSARAAARLVPAELAPVEDTHQRALDEEVLEQMRNQELWRLVGQRLNSEAERVVIIDAFVYGLKPAAIQARRPDLFASVNEVYLIKRNMIERLEPRSGAAGAVGLARKLRIESGELRMARNQSSLVAGFSPRWAKNRQHSIVSTAAAAMTTLS